MYLQDNLFYIIAYLRGDIRHGAAASLSESLYCLSLSSRSRVKKVSRQK